MTPSNPEHCEPGTHVLRCWNLALAAVSVVLLGMIWAGPIGPSNGITIWPYARHWIDAEAFWGFGKGRFAVALLVDLLLPASLMAALLCLLSSRWVGQRSKGLQIWLVMIWAFYVISVLVGGPADTDAAIFMIFGRIVLGTLLAIAGPLIILAGAMYLFSGSKTGEMEWTKLMATLASAPICLGLLALHPSNPYGGTSARTKAYEEMCKRAGVKYFALPEGITVESVVLAKGDHLTSITTDGKGWPTSHGATLSPHQPKLLSNLWFGVGPFQRMKTNGAIFSPPEPTHPNPDVIVLKSASNPAELMKAPIHQSAVEYRLSVVAAKSNVTIAEMSYAIDQINQRACGTTHGNAIDEMSFVYEALSPR